MLLLANQSVTVPTFFLYLIRAARCCSEEQKRGAVQRRGVVQRREDKRRGVVRCFFFLLCCSSSSETQKNPKKDSLCLKNPCVSRSVVSFAALKSRSVVSLGSSGRECCFLWNKKSAFKENSRCFFFFLKHSVFQNRSVVLLFSERAEEPLFFRGSSRRANTCSCSSFWRIQRRAGSFGSSLLTKKDSKQRLSSLNSRTTEQQNNRKKRFLKNGSSCSSSKEETRRTTERSSRFGTAPEEWFVPKERFLGFFKKQEEQQGGSWGSSVFQKRTPKRQVTTPLVLSFFSDGKHQVLFASSFETRRTILQEQLFFVCVFQKTAASLWKTQARGESLLLMVNSSFSFCSCGTLKILLEMNGLEPITSCVQSKRSTNWTTSPKNTKMYLLLKKKQLDNVVCSFTSFLVKNAFSMFSN